MCCGQTKQEVARDDSTWWRRVHINKKVFIFGTRGDAERVLSQGLDGTLSPEMRPVFEVLKEQWERART